MKDLHISKASTFEKYKDGQLPVLGIPPSNMPRSFKAVYKKGWRELFGK